MKIASHTFEFIERWRQKGLDYSLDEYSSNYYDRFFTGFVLYNFLYNKINKCLCLKVKKDSEKAIAAAKAFLTSEAIFRENAIKTMGNEIRHLIETKEFYVWDKIADKADRNEQAVEQMYSSESDAWVNGLLKIIYGVRCNMFHGEKDFLGNQKKILKPCICVIEKLNDLIIQKFQNDDENSAACSPRENAL